MALILRNGGSQSPDRWLKEPRNNQFIITAQKLVVKRINELCKEHNLNYYALAYKAAIPKSTLLNIIHGTNPTIETIQKICGGFDISLGTFFNTDYFYEIYDDE